jgi:hypothetical protein
VSRFPRQTAAAAALLAALFAGGCATTIAGTPSADPAPRPTSGPGADPAAWTDKVCGALVTYWKPMTPGALPNFADDKSEDAIKKRLSDYLGTVSGAIDQGQQQLKAAGASPVTGGDDLVKSYADAMTRNGKTVADAKAEVDSVDPANAQAFQQKLDSADAKLKTFAAPQGLDKLGNTPRLVKAIEKSPKCGEYRSITQPPPP